MCILSTRKFGTPEAVAFSAALSGNTSLAELLASGHPLDVAGATAFGEALSRNTTLRSLCVGDNNFGDKVCMYNRRRWDGVWDWSHGRDRSALEHVFVLHCMVKPVTPHPAPRCTHVVSAIDPPRFAAHVVGLK